MKNISIIGKLLGDTAPLLAKHKVNNGKSKLQKNEINNLMSAY